MNRTHWTSLALAVAMFGAPALASAAPGSAQFGAPRKQTFFGEVGYSGMPRLGYLAPVNPRLAIGGEFILDIGAFNSLASGVPGNLTLAAGLPIRMVLMQDKKLVVGAAFTPGLGVGIPRFGDAAFALLLHSEINVGYRVNQQITVGGAAEIPLTFYIGNASGAVIPVLFGPAVDFALTPEWSLLGELKLGPHIAAGDGLGSNVSLGFQFQVGAAYSF